MRYLNGLLCGALLTAGLATQAQAGAQLGAPSGQPAAGEVVSMAIDNGNAAGSSKTDPAAVADLQRAQTIYSKVSDAGTGSAQLRDALKIALPTVEKFQQTGDNSNLVDCLFLIGNCYFELREWASAEKFMTNCYELGTRYFPDEMGSAPLKVIGESQYRQQKSEDALKTFQARVQRIQKMGAALDQGELAGALYDVAEQMILLDRAHEAEALLAQAESANQAAGAALAKPDSKATQEDKDANALDHAEIVFDQAIALFKQDKFQECRPKLEKALGLFDAVQNGGREMVTDRLVAVLDDLVVVCDKLGDKTASETYKARRDKLNQ